MRCLPLPAVHAGRAPSGPDSGCPGPVRAPSPAISMQLPRSLAPAAAGGGVRVSSSGAERGVGFRGYPNSTLPAGVFLRSNRIRTAERSGRRRAAATTGNRGDDHERRTDLYVDAGGGRLPRRLAAHARPLPGEGQRAGVPPLRRPGAVSARRSRRLGDDAAPRVHLGRRHRDCPGPGERPTARRRPGQARPGAAR